MKNYIKLLGIIAFVAIIVFGAAACKGKNAGSAAPAVSSSDNKIDGLLKEYEKFVNDYTALMQRMKAGDAAAAAEAQEFATKMQEWGERWDGVSESDFTPAQQQKLLDLINKTTSALQ